MLVRYIELSDNKRSSFENFYYRVSWMVLPLFFLSCELELSLDFSLDLNFSTHFESVLRV